MPIKEKNTEPRTRHLHRGSTGMPNLTEQQIKKLNGVFNFQEDLGIPLDESGSPTYSGNVPRAFIVSADKNHVDTLDSLSNKDAEIGSAEFWRQVQLGNVFVYPAGQQKPSQLQINISDTQHTPSLSLSKPLDAIPDRAEVKRPNFWHRMWAWAVPSYKERVQSWDNQIYSQVKSTVEQYTKDRDDLGQMEKEKRELQDKLADQSKKEYEASHSAQMKEQEEKYEIVDACMENTENVFGIKPTSKPSYFSVEQPYCTSETFQKLKDYSGELKMNELKSNGKSFTDDDFTVMSYFTAQKQEHLKKGVEGRTGYRESLKNALMIGGVDEKTAEYVHNQQGMMVSSTDFTNQSFLRGNDGTQSIEPTIQPARKETKEAFQEYKAGKKDKLAGLVANAVKEAAREYTSRNAEGGKFSDGLKGQIELMGRLGQFIEKDPQLAQIAEKKYGMKPEDFKLVQGLGEYKKLNDARRKAEEKLAQAEKSGAALSEEEKKQCLKDIVKADQIEQMMVKDMQEKKDSPQMEQIRNKLFEKVMEQPRKRGTEVDGVFVEDKQASDPNKIPMTDLYVITNSVLPGIYNERSKMVGTIKADSPALDAAAEAIIKTDKLNDPNLSPGQLYDKVKDGEYSMEALSAATAAMQSKANGAPENQGPAVEQNVLANDASSVKDRAKMFENKENDSQQIL